MSALTNSKHERYAQLIAAGVSQRKAYVEAGYIYHASGASELKVRCAIRIAELTAAQGTAIERALTAKQRFIARGWEKITEALNKIPLETAQEIGVLADRVLAAEKDQRVVDGGVSDRSENVVNSTDELDPFADLMSGYSATDTTGKPSLVQ